MKDFTKKDCLWLGDSGKLKVSVGRSSIPGPCRGQRLKRDRA